MANLTNPYASEMRKQIVNKTNEKGSLAKRVKQDLDLNESSRTVDRWLTGQNDMGIEMLVKISKEYDISLDQVFDLN